MSHGPNSFNEPTVLNPLNPRTAGRYNHFPGIAQRWTDLAHPGLLWPSFWSVLGKERLGLSLNIR